MAWFPRAWYPATWFNRWFGGVTLQRDIVLSVTWSPKYPIAISQASITQSVWFQSGLSLSVEWQPIAPWIIEAGAVLPTTVSVGALDGTRINTSREETSVLSLPTYEWSDD